MKQLCQIVIEAGAGNVLPARKYYRCGLNGRYKAHLVGIVWADKSSTGLDSKLITIQSDCFRMPYGSVSQSIVFSNRGFQDLPNPAGEFPLMIEVMGNNIDFTLSSSSPYTGSGSSSFDYCVLSFTVEPITD